jgi:hypothetical protein
MTRLGGQAPDATTPPPTPAASEARIKAALWFAAQGFGVFPCWSALDGVCRCPKGAACGSPAKHPLSEHGFKDATTDEKRIRTFLSAASLPNYGLVCPDGVFALDVDGEGWEARLAELETRLGPLPPTLRTATRNGQHIYLRWPEGLPRPMKQMFGWVTRWGSGGTSGYVIGPRSVHVSGFEYAPVGSFEVATLPDAWARAAVQPEASGSLTIKAGGDPSSVEPGHRHDFLRDQARFFAGSIRDPDALFAAVWALNEKLSVPKTVDEVKRAIGDALTKYPADPVEVTEDGEVRVVRQATDATPALIPASGVDFPPAPSAAAFTGLIGECVDAIAEGTDASRVGILTALLAWLGALVPASTYFGSGEQTTSPYMALVGVSAMARKGTTMTRVKDALGDALGADALNRVRLSGIASGEGLIMALSARQKDDRDPWAIGVMAEAEFASVLAAASREGSTLDSRLREAFDGEQLWHTRVSSVVTVKQPYWLSALIAITPSELQDKLPKGALLNGSGNRWLYVPVERRDVQSAGHIRPDIPMDVRRGLIAARQATKAGPVSIPTDAATAQYLSEYERWLYANSVGLAADLTRRYSTIALRVALINAAVEMAPTVRPEHAERAIALTEYARSGLPFAFGNAFAGDDWSSLLLQHLHAEGGVLSAQYISKTLIKHPLQRDKAVKDLQRLRLATVRVVPTRGRPRTELVLSDTQGAPFAPFAPFSGLRASDEPAETSDPRSRKGRESGAEGARKPRESGAEGSESTRVCPSCHYNHPAGTRCAPEPAGALCPDCGAGPFVSEGFYQRHWHGSHR